MLLVFGKPKWSGAPEDQGKNGRNLVIVYEYEGVGEFPGTLTVTVSKRSGVILEMDLVPNNLSKDEAIKHFGNDYRLTRYESDDCLSDGESVPVYESPEGADVKIEYRNRGIAIDLNYQVNLKKQWPRPKHKIYLWSDLMRALLNILKNLQRFAIECA